MENKGCIISCDTRDISSGRENDDNAIFEKLSCFNKKGILLKYGRRVPADGYCEISCEGGQVRNTMCPKITYHEVCPLSFRKI